MSQLQPRNSQHQPVLAGTDDPAPSPYRQEWWPTRQRWIVIGMAGATLLLLILVASSMSRKMSPEATLTNTATPLFPTVSTSTLPYIDSQSGFAIHYPNHWQRLDQNPGVEFDDSAQNPTYILQILLPSGQQDPTKDWVAYELDNLRQATGATDVRITPGMTQMTIGGQLWSGSGATLHQDASIIAVQILATVHNDRVYVINMLAENVSMADAQSRYYTSMLATFRFIA